MTLMMRNMTTNRTAIIIPGIIQPHDIGGLVMV
jgi:hypothetical protein